MGRFDKLGKALETAIAKLEKAKAAGEAVGKQTGVDTRSFDKLMRSAKFENMKKGLPAAAGATALGGAALGPDDANAAGLTTIAKKLGVSLEEAAKIKEAALKSIGKTSADENMRAIQDVSKYLKNSGEGYLKLGQGMDYNAFTTPGGKVLKVPKSGWNGIQEESIIAPSIVEQVGLGPKTKTIETGDRRFLVQDAVTPLDKINLRYKPTPEIEGLNNEIRQLMPILSRSALDSPEYKQTIERLNEIDVILDKKKREAVLANKDINAERMLKQYESASPREKATYDRFSIRSPEELLDDPTGAFEAGLKNEADAKLRHIIMPRDTHSGNIGIDANRSPVIFDTSRFSDVMPEALSPEMKAAIKSDVIALPKSKNQLMQDLENPKASRWTSFARNQDEFGMPSNLESSARKAAAIGAMPALENPAESIMSAYNKYIDEPRKQLANKILEGTTPLQGEDKRRFIEETKPAMELATDPELYMPGFAGLAFPVLRHALTRDQEK